ncbi:hypothetical protein NPX13_g3754 [Xylaria arbuscula]|uniref:DUF7708 domain-containing protein n=1 Tax=Xylaria arbuscula TaxID=114810 RepID=A0A9W8NHV5_9PEZI|nr:hypothetical protein NPX13_g3754 [Xylaria arbuscula]
MASTSPIFDDAEERRLEGRVIIRRFTDQLTGADELEQSTIAAQEEIDKEEELAELKRLKLLYENPPESNTSSQDFEVAMIAREALAGVVEKFNDDVKPTMRQRMGLSTSKPAQVRATEVLENSMHGDFNELKASVDNLEQNWKDNHGRIYKCFKSLCGTFDDHKSILAIFPTQEVYASAAKNHSDIADTLSQSIAKISDKVATCSNLIVIIKTQRLRKKLANIYARMFEFYRNAIKWYLQSNLSRVFSSFNENLKKECEDATDDIEDCINELYREASVSSTAMIAILNGKVSNLESELRRQRQNYAQQDTAAGRRMVVMMEASWMDSRIAGRTIESANPTRLIETASRVQDVTPAGMTRAQARAHDSTIKLFIIGDEGPGLFGEGKFWLAEDEVLPRLRAWMVEDKLPRTLWVSSPYDMAGTTSARASALAVVSAAWQAETPLISHFCQRPQPRQVRSGMSIVRVGLVGLVYSLIHQLLQFNAEGETLPFSEEQIAALDGSNDSWETGLEVLRILLEHTPVLMYCVIDGLNDLEWGDGGRGCRQVLEVLFARQRKTGTVFNILLTTAGQSLILPSCVNFRDRHIATKEARELERYGRRIEL